MVSSLKKIGWLAAAFSIFTNEGETDAHANLLPDDTGAAAEDTKSGIIPEQTQELLLEHFPLASLFGEGRSKYVYKAGQEALSVM